MSAREVFAEVVKDMPFYGKDGGVTFSGGEPLVQVGFLAELLRLCKAHGINTAVDTAGCAPWANIEAVMDLTDIFLYDIKAIDPNLHKSGTERNNRMILKNLDRILQAGKNIIIRIPVIPGFNDGRELERIKTYAEGKKIIHKNLIDIELLPYHDLGAVKYERRIGDDKYAQQLPYLCRHPRVGDTRRKNPHRAAIYQPK